MSFMQPRSAISICNAALGRISQQKVSGTLTSPVNFIASTCAEAYPRVVRTLLEQHHFGLATRRVALVEQTNDRPSEWLAAYAPPSDMAFPVTVLPYGVGQVQYYPALNGLIAKVNGFPIFLHSGGVIYSIVAWATLEYVSLNITEQDFNQTFENLVITFLASILAEPIVKDRALAKDLYEEGMGKLNWAIAQSLNATQPRYGDMPTETELERGGGIGSVAARLGLPY